MASPQSSPALQKPGQALVKQIQANSLLVRNLQNICQLNGLGRSGVKAELQRRIIRHINDCVSRNDYRAFSEIEASVRENLRHAPGYSSLAQQPATQYYTPSPSTVAPPYGFQPAYQMASSPHTYHPAAGSLNGHRPPPSSSQTLLFKSSPFYDIRSMVGDVRVCDVMSQHRNSVSISVRLQDHPDLQLCAVDSTMRVMLFCAGDRIGVQDIAFPHQSELKVNNVDVKANLRGLKNKPGSTRPVDITNNLRLKHAYPNSVEFTYALTTKKFYLALFVCQTTAVPVLAARIANGQKIRKASVIAEMTRKAQDPDVVATSQVLSLKCPLTYMRLSVPCRAITCSHIQCFDATSYLQLQEQGPQWLCPICNKPAPFTQLAVDEYVRDILDNTEKSVDQVTIEPDGKWSVQGAESKDESYSADMSFLNEDDGIAISADVSIVGGWGPNTPNRSTTSIGTPATAFSRESSSMPRSSTSNKRPAAEVIDLTLSDDDDDELPRPPAKRLDMRPDARPFIFQR